MQRVLATSTAALARNSSRIVAQPSRSLLRPSPALRPWTPCRAFAWSSLARTDILSSSSSASTSSPTSTSSADIEVETHALPPPSESSSPPEVIKLEPRKAISFNCGVEDCGVRQTHEFTKRSYEKGIVIVQCPGCKSRHLIADNLGWFKEITEEGKQRTVEDFVKAKGISIRRGHVDPDGAVTEYAPE